MAQPKHVFTEGFFSARSAGSLGVAAALEILIFVGVAAGIIYHQLHPEPPAPPIVTPAVTIPPNPPPPPPPPPQNQVQPQIQQPQPLSEVPPIPVPVPTPDAVPPPPPQPPVIPVSKPEDTQAIQNQFYACMLGAINAQKHYPKESLLAGDTGTATVQFTYINGVASDVKVIKSSGARPLDRAAIQAVQTAQLCQKPAELVSTTSFKFDVNFSLGN